MVHTIAWLNSIGYDMRDYQNTYDVEGKGDYFKLTPKQNTDD